MIFKLDPGYLYYESTGKGNPILFIHGYPLSHKIWTAQMTELGNIANTNSVDLRGHGSSYPFTGTYPMDLLAEDCYKLLQSLKTSLPAVICGLSMGGYVAFALYRNHPELFRGIILTSTRAASDSPEGKANRDAGIKNVQERGVSSIVDGMLPKLVAPQTLQTNPALISSIREIMMETSVSGIMGALQGMRDRPDSTNLLPLISCPTLIIHGADDQLIPVSEAEKMHAGIPNSQLVVIPESGHLVNMEKPGQYNHAIRNFVSQLN